MAQGRNAATRELASRIGQRMERVSRFPEPLDGMRSGRLRRIHAGARLRTAKPYAAIGSDCAWSRPETADHAPAC